MQIATYSLRAVLALAIAAAPLANCDKARPTTTIDASRDSAAAHDSAIAPGICWQGDAEGLGAPDECRTDAALRQNSCADRAFPSLDDSRAKPYQMSFMQRGFQLDPRAMLNNFLGFFVSDTGVFVSAIHAFEGCVSAAGINREYAAWRDGGPANCDENLELLYVGPAARYVPPPATDFTCPASCPPATSSTSTCFDCDPLHDVGDIVIGRVRQRAALPPQGVALNVAQQHPIAAEPIALMGKPNIPDIVPWDQRRLSFGRYGANAGTGVLVSAYASPGFSGGAMLNSCGEVFAVTVSRVNDLRVRDESWNKTHAIGVSLIAYREQLQNAISYATEHPLP